MTVWLTEEWFAETRSLAAGLDCGSHVTATVEAVVTGLPDGDLRSHWMLEDGRLVGCAPGRAGPADLTLTISRDDAAALQRGELDASVAFMQGRMKVSGSMDALLALLPLTRTGGYQAFMTDIAARTEF